MTPSTPPGKGLWKPTEPSPDAIQHHYVAARVHEVNKLADQAKNRTVQALERDYPAVAQGQDWQKRRYWEIMYDSMTGILQSRELTINFAASSWFLSENKFDTYSQMYERGIDSTGKMLLKDNPMNPAQYRALVDDFVTFPQHWQNSGAPVRRGLVPGNHQPLSSIASRMRTGTQLPTDVTSLPGYMDAVPLPDGTVAYRSKNPKFNPKTKQVFAALNYGRRPHGSNVYYGMSHIVLNRELKTDAIYFPGDTFGLPSPDSQATFKTLASVYLGLTPPVRQDLVKSCVHHMVLPDTNGADYFVEAHLFTQLRFGTGVSEMRLEQCPNPLVTANAQKFCRKWGIRFTQL